MRVDHYAFNAKINVAKGNASDDDKAHPMQNLVQNNTDRNNHKEWGYQLVQHRLERTGSPQIQIWKEE
jgi:hypothetical protein